VWLVGMLLVAPQALAQGDDPTPAQSVSACAQGPVGPTLDPIVGQRVGRDELDCLPSGRHLGAVVDVWFNQVINQQISGGGMAFFDPVRFSSHGGRGGRPGSISTASTSPTRRVRVSRCSRCRTRRGMAWPTGRSGPLAPG